MSRDPAKVGKRRDGGRKAGGISAGAPSLGAVGSVGS